MKRVRSVVDVTVGVGGDDSPADDHSQPSLEATNQQSQPRSKKSRKCKLTAEQNDSIQATIDSVVSRASLSQESSDEPLQCDKQSMGQEGNTSVDDVMNTQSIVDLMRDQLSATERSTFGDTQIDIEA